MIEKCVFRPFDGEQACTDVINIAKDNLETILKPNLKQLLDALDSKMNSDSIVVFNGYAQFVSAPIITAMAPGLWLHQQYLTPRTVQHGDRRLRRQSGLDAI